MACILRQNMPVHVTSSENYQLLERSSFVFADWAIRQIPTLDKPQK